MRFAGASPGARSRLVELQRDGNGVDGDVAPGEVGLTQAAADLVDDDISAGRKPPTKEAGKKKRGKIAIVEGEAADDADDEPKAKPAKGDIKKPGKGKKGK